MGTFSTARRPLRDTCHRSLRVLMVTSAPSSSQTPSGGKFQFRQGLPGSTRRPRERRLASCANLRIGITIRTQFDTPQTEPTGISGRGVAHCMTSVRERNRVRALNQAENSARSVIPRIRTEVAVKCVEALARRVQFCRRRCAVQLFKVGFAVLSITLIPATSCSKPTASANQYSRNSVVNVTRVTRFEDFSTRHSTYSS